MRLDARFAGGNEPTLVLLAHGSRDPRHAATIGAVAAAVRAHRPGLDVRTAYLDHDAPHIGAVVAGLGTRPAVVVPLLLGNAYHGRVDVPTALAAALRVHPEARVALGGLLGVDPALLSALAARLTGVGADLADPATGIVLASAGSSDPRAREALEGLARRWRPGVEVGCAAGGGRSVGEAVGRVRAAGARRVVVASWFLAPGLLWDRARADALAHGADAVAGVLADRPEVVSAVLRRYASTAARAASAA